MFIEVLKPEKPDPATTIRGLDYVDVPGLAKKEYKVNFYAHREGAFSSKVTVHTFRVHIIHHFYVSKFEHIEKVLCGLTFEKISSIFSNELLKLEGVCKLELSIIARISFLPLKVCSSLCVQVTFRNEQTGEFQFYYVTFKVGSPGTIGTIELSTPVRQSISHVVTINNPLSAMVNFQTNCNIQDVNLPPQLTIPAHSEVSAMLMKFLCCRAMV